MPRLLSRVTRSVCAHLVPCLCKTDLAAHTPSIPSAATVGTLSWLQKLIALRSASPSSSSSQAVPLTVFGDPTDGPSGARRLVLSVRVIAWPDRRSGVPPRGRANCNWWERPVVGLLESNLLLTVDIRRTAFYDNITMHEFVPPSVSFVDVHDTFVLRSCAAFHVHNNVLRSTLRSYEAIDTMSMVAVFAVYVSLARGSVLMIDNATVRVDWPPEGMMRIGRESLNATVLLLQPTGGTVGLPKQMDR